MKTIVGRNSFPDCMALPSYCAMCRRGHSINVRRIPGRTGCFECTRNMTRKQKLVCPRPSVCLPIYFLTLRIKNQMMGVDNGAMQKWNSECFKGFDPVSEDDMSCV